MQGLLDEWPVSRLGNWVALLNEARTELDEQRIAESIRRNRPLGEAQWVAKVVKRLGLEHTIRRPGRPAKKRSERNPKWIATPYHFLGVRPPGSCHFPLAGWSEFARLIEPLIERDIYGQRPAGPFNAPNLKLARFTSNARDAIA